MTPENSSRLPSVLERHESELLTQWCGDQVRELSGQRGQISEVALRSECQEFLGLFRRAVQRGGLTDTAGTPWEEVRAMLTRLSHSRARLGYSPRHTASFVFSLKRPLFQQLRAEYQSDPVALTRELGTAGELLDSLGLYTTDAFIAAREDVITRQQEELLELSTPVVKLWDGILALPMIGTLDSARTQVVMESLLQRIVETGAEVAIIDITGVPTVDTLVAQHLLKTVTAARLMGADCIISGIRPQIAQTIVHLGVQLGDVVTKATLADAFAVALQRRGVSLNGSLVRR